jgi:hypothetical protein
MMDNTFIPTSKIMKVIDNLVANGFKPSWNPDTNNAHLPTEKATASQPVTPQIPSQSYQPKEDLGFCKKCGAKNVRNPKTGKTFCEKKCWLKE